MFCSAVCKFSVYGLILSITFDTEGGIYRTVGFRILSVMSFPRIYGKLL